MNSSSFEATAALVERNDTVPDEPVPARSRHNGVLLATLTLGALCVLYLSDRGSLDGQLLTAGLCGLLGVLAVRLRRKAAAEARAQAASVAVQHSLPFDDRSALATVGDELLRQARRQKRPLSVMAFDISDLPELKSIFGHHIARRFVTGIVGKLQAMAPANGRVLRTGPTTFAVLLPGFDREAALSAVRAALGQACCIEFDVGEDEIVLVPDFRIQTVGHETESFEDFYQALCRDLTEAQHFERRRRQYLQRQRESYTRPAPLAPTGEQDTIPDSCPPSLQRDRC